MKFKFIAIVLALGATQELWAKDCTESHIRSAISSKKKFDFDAEGCSDAVVKVSKGISLGGGITIDGRNRMKITWSGSGFKCDEIPRGDEAAVFYTAGNGNTIKNLTILKSPEGIHISKGKNNVVDNVTFELICEDAITNGNKTSASATGTIIRNSLLKNGPDKAIQCNGGSVTVENTEFRNIPRAFAACTYKADGANHGAKECPIPCNMQAYNNKVYGCNGGYGMRGAGYLQGKKQGKLTAVGNYFKDCKNPFMAAQYGFVYAEDNVSEGRCDAWVKTEEKGSGQVCNNKGCSSEGGSGVERKCASVTPGPGPTPNPEPNPQPQPDPVEKIVEYKFTGKGGTKSGNHANACTLAQTRGIDGAKAQCSGTVVKSSAEACSCVKKNSQESTCEAEGFASCRLPSASAFWLAEQ